MRKKSIRKLKPGVLKKEYGYKIIADEIGFNHTYFSLFKNEGEKVERYFELLAVGTICYLEEEKNKEEFIKICEKIKQDPVYIKPEDLQKPLIFNKNKSKKEYLNNLDKYIEKGLEYKEAYGLTYEILSDTFSAINFKKQNDEKFLLWLEKQLPNFPTDFFKEDKEDEK